MMSASIVLTNESPRSSCLVSYNTELLHFYVLFYQCQWTKFLYILSILNSTYTKPHIDHEERDTNTTTQWKRKGPFSFKRVAFSTVPVSQTFKNFYLFQIQKTDLFQVYFLEPPLFRKLLLNKKKSDSGTQCSDQGITLQSGDYGKFAVLIWLLLDP